MDWDESEAATNGFWHHSNGRSICALDFLVGPIVYEVFTRGTDDVLGTFSTLEEAKKFVEVS